MKTASVSKLKASLSAYLRRVERGEEVLVTDRGRPVARLTPVPSCEGLPAHLQEMIRNGQARMGSGKLPPGFWDLPRPKVAVADVLSALDEDRNESW